MFRGNPKQREKYIPRRFTRPNTPDFQVKPTGLFSFQGNLLDRANLERECAGMTFVV
jgi:hypothetical protein